MTASTKLHQLESKISDLQKQQQVLLKERQQEIASLIFMVDLAHLDDKILLGGLLYLKDKITNQDAASLNLLEAWRDAGKKFLRQYKPRTSSLHQSYAGEKKTGNRPQGVTKKTPSFTSTHVPQTTNQSLQESPQSREA